MPKGRGSRRITTVMDKRKAGVLAPISSLPSSCGIGSFDAEAERFIDFLASAGQSYWQVLPLGPTGYGDSPYQSFSSFAGNPYFISLDGLLEENLLSETDVSSSRKPVGSIDYSWLYETRLEVLRKAFRRFKPDEKHFEFERQEKWLDEFSLYMSIKMSLGGQSWQTWPEGLKKRRKSALGEARAFLAEEIEFWKFIQRCFFKQWGALKERANRRGISIIGDIPIYAAMDSADAWAHPELFFFDEDLNPIEVSGCPPDAFSADGQLWGNPLYRWDYHKETGFAWWKERILHTKRLYDITRIDHFRGFQSYYAIPASNKTAKGGHWEAGPGFAFFEAIGKGPFILENLGYLDREVSDLLERTGCPGMKVLQFAFDSREESDYMPHTYTNNCVVYTGTHDNDTSAGWFKTAPPEDAELARKYLNVKDGSDGSWEFMRSAYASAANTAIIPLQDILGLGSDARLNTPSTVSGNWRWRYEKEALTDELAGRLKEFTKTYRRD
ncbi:MAG: 4-alpha-glucanotransferase [Clostridiales bacterium]|jgi:4-alpha-glucanotransferase|nr:4-alpha-glucanotransferase [Clostridiales bacterium]